MKNKLKFAGLILFTATSITACRGGVNAQKQDSTMLDTNARDSAAALSSAAHADSNKTDTTKKDTSKKM